MRSPVFLVMPMTYYLVVMTVPPSELPNVEQIKVWALQNLPANYRLLDVRCEYGTDIPHVLPADWELRIEYANTSDSSTFGRFEDMKVYHSWADPLIAKIRADWPASTLRIGIPERLADIA